jgi:PiT family inorganic phosphate transporter
MREEHASHGFRLGQIASSSLVALAHGTNDAQKTMGVVTLTLVPGGRLGADEPIPFWVKLICAAAIAAGTFSGGWRVIRTLG